MGERANGDAIDPGVGDLANVREGHATASLCLATAADELYGAAKLVGRHVVEKDNVGAGFGGFGGLIQGVCFDFDFERWRFFSRGLDREGDVSSESSKVIVLDEHHVEEPEAMVLAAAAFDGVFLESTPTGSGFAGIENFCARAAHRIHELARERGDSGEALNEIQGDAFGSENGTRVTLDGEQVGAFRDGVPVARMACHFVFAERGFSERDAREHQWLARGHDCGGARMGRNCGFRGNIARAEILGDGEANGAADFLRIQRQTSFQGSRYSRVSNLVASGSPTITSFLASHLILRLTSMEMSPRWPGMAELCATSAGVMVGLRDLTESRKLR